MDIFRADTQHLDGLSNLFDQYRQFYQKPADPEGCRQFLEARLANNESIIFAATSDDGRLAGFTQLYQSYCSVEMGRIMYLYDLFVAHGTRRQGVARALMHTAMRHGMECGAVRLQLDTAVDNRPAQALYESLGWKRDDTFCTYHLELH